MISEEKLEKLYEKLMTESKLTKEQLQTCELTDEDINRLLEEGKLQLVAKECYIFKAVGQLVQYGKKCINPENDEKAIQIFERCLQLDPNNIIALHQLMIRYLFHQEYQKVCECLYILIHSSYGYYQKDHLFHLYILSTITDIPPKCQNIISKMRLEDMQISEQDPRWYNKIQEQTLRKLVYGQKYAKALSYLNKLKKERMNHQRHDMITRNLLGQGVRAQMDNKEKILQMLMKEDYQGMLAYIEQLKAKQRLRSTDELTYILLKDILDIITKKQIPVSKISDTKSVTIALKAKNYLLAQSLLKTFSIHGNYEVETTINYQLISNILKEIEKIKTKDGKENDRKTEMHSNNIDYAQFRNAVENFEKKENIARVIDDIFTVGLSLEETCQKYKLKEEAKNYLALLMAKSYYKKGYYEQGDKFLIKVEKAKGKTQMIQTMLEEIRKNKKFYQNRTVESQKCLVLGSFTSKQEKR